jgi:hypothetical protein
VRDGDAIGLFDDVVGRGWALVSVAGDPRSALDADTAEFFRALGGITAGVGPDGPVRDLDGVYARWFQEAGVTMALQRPDFHVYGTAASEHEGRDLIRRLERALAAAARGEAAQRA